MSTAGVPKFKNDFSKLGTADGQIHIERGSADAADATVESDPGTLASLLWGGRPLDDAVRAGAISIEGSTAAVERFLGLFPLPERAAAPDGAG